MDNLNTPINTLSSSYISQPVDNKKKDLTKPVVIITIFIIIVFGIFLFRRQSTSNQSEKITPTLTQEPSPTPIPNIDKKTVKIQVLNGTGTPGQANSAVNALTAAGYSKDNITTDNAADYNHTLTTISTKANFSSITSDIKSALSSTFDNISIDSSPLDNDSKYDIIVTTGGKIYEAPITTPTEIPTSTPTPNPSTTSTLTPTPTNTPTPTP